MKTKLLFIINLILFNSCYDEQIVRRNNYVFKKSDNSESHVQLDTIGEFRQFDLSAEIEFDLPLYCKFPFKIVPNDSVFCFSFILKSDTLTHCLSLRQNDENSKNYFLNPFVNNEDLNIYDLDIQYRGKLIHMGEICHLFSLYYG